MVPGGLLERKGELARIDRLLTTARAGRGGVVVITGPAGIGKTALLTEAEERAGRAGMRVLAGNWRADFRSAWRGSFSSRC
jgi:predicted ATPase